MISRRKFLDWGAGGLGTAALVSLLGREKVYSAVAGSAAPTAKRAINICLVGGLSQVDSFDYKPELEKLHGQAPSIDKKLYPGNPGPLCKNEWAFKQHGESGLWVSEMFPHLAGVADELTVIKSMVSDTSSHTPALFLCNSGFASNGFPSLGSWLSYGLGNEADSLPTFVVIPDVRGMPSGGTTSWSSAFLPAQHQGVPLQGGPEPMRDLFPAGDRAAAAAADAASGPLLKHMAAKQLERLGGRDPILEARLKSYELAARMQLSVPEVASLQGEPEYLTREYGLGEEPTNDFARSCLLARRLIERGVRFVQLYSGGPLGGKPRSSWDAHEKMVPNHTREAARIDKPVAALLMDLKRRGLLDDTLVTFTTEFGRTPFKTGDGRDHNKAGFTVWMAGAGLNPGLAYGSSDEIGFAAAENPVSWHDFHATVLHLFGIDHTELTYYHNGIERRLTNVHGKVVEGILG